MSTMHRLPSITSGDARYAVPRCSGDWGTHNAYQAILQVSFVAVDYDMLMRTGPSVRC